jgi:hypothetical protein
MKYFEVAIVYLLVVALMLIETSLVVSAAETSRGWVVWQRETMLSLKKSSEGKDVVEYGNVGPWEVANAAEDMEECQSLLKKYARRMAKRLEKIAEKEARVIANGNFLTVEMRLETLLGKPQGERPQAIPGLYNFLCLPGTVDPR